MMRSLLYFAFAAVLCSGFVQADESAVRHKLFSEDGWVAYQIPMIEGAGSPCCWSGKVGGDFHKAGCNLDLREGSTLSDRSTSGSSSELSVYWHVLDGKPDQVRAYAADCPVKTEVPIRWIKPMQSRDSIDLLADWTRQNNVSRDEGESGLVALAWHADAYATDVLIGFADGVGEEERRKHAIFWLGQTRGVPGVEFVEKLAIADPSPDLREHAVFSLSQSNVIDAYERVRSIAKREESSEVRGKTYFWMAQMNNPRAQADIIAALDRETSEDARDQAIFALSQLGDDKATSALIAVVRGKYPRLVKEKALFWLGQAGTDEGMRFLDEMLAR